MAACARCKEALWLQQVLEFFNLPQPTLQMKSDSQSALAIMDNPVVSQKSKHIDIQYHFLRQKVAEKKVAFSFAPTADMIADGLTKALPKLKFVAFRNNLGVQ
jgi:hypothetical protein